MHFKSLLKSALLLSAPLFAYADAGDDECAKPEKINSDACKADILIVTSSAKNQEQIEGYQSVVNTLKKFSVPANRLTVDANGVSDEEIIRILYSDFDQKQGRYSAIVFPNGRVSYNNGNGSGSEEDLWKSAISWNQWQIFTQYSANTGSRIVYLNEYPSNNTGTDLASNVFNLGQKIRVTEDSVMYDELTKLKFDLDTEDTWHYPAKIRDESTNAMDGFQEVTPLLYFEPAQGINGGQGIPEETVAAVECDNNGAKYAGFFTSFGSWSPTADALNIYWLTWALNTDFSKISQNQVSTEEALGIAMSAAPKTAKLAVGYILLSTIFVIAATLI